MFQLFCFYWLCLTNPVLLTSPTRDELLLQDPSLWPGHLEPFASKQNISEGIEELTEWPDPTTFFAEYVDKSRPVLLKSLAKRSPGFALFNDDYFKSAPGAENIIIYAESEKKENRTKGGYDLSIKEFVERYHNESLYMVYNLPLRFSHNVLMPAPLRCESTRNLMVSKIMWMSDGGTKSVLHNDNVDNINCLFRGTKQLWLIDHRTNEPYVPIDHPNGAYSSLDVERVNYTAFPQLRKIDVYHRVMMDEGDCLFIPLKWYHQVNSFSNHQPMNLAVNIWFNHEQGHVPTGCDIPEHEATLDKWEFQEASFDILKHFSAYTGIIDDMQYREFMEVIKVDYTINPTAYHVKENTKQLKILAGKLFTSLDLNGDGKVSKKDWDELPAYNTEKLKKLQKTVKKYFFDVKGYFLKLSDDSGQPISEQSNDQGIIRDEF